MPRGETLMKATNRMFRMEKYFPITVESTRTQEQKKN